MANARFFFSKFQKTTPAPLITTTSTTPFSSTEQFLPIGNRFGDDFDYVDSKTEEIQTTTNIANIDEIGSNEMEVVTTNYENSNVEIPIDLKESSSQSSSTEIQIENGIESNIIISSTTTYIFVNPSPSTNRNPQDIKSSSNPQMTHDSPIQNMNPNEMKLPIKNENPQNYDTKVIIKNESPIQNFNNEMGSNTQNFDTKVIIKNENPIQNFGLHETKFIIRNENPIPNTNPQYYDTKFVIRNQNPIPNQNYQNFNPNGPIETFSHAQTFDTIKNSYDIGPPPPITNNAQNIHTIITNSENPVAPQTIYVIQNPQHPHRILFNKKAKPSVKNKFTNNIALKICKNGRHINDIQVESHD